MARRELSVRTADAGGAIRDRVEVRGALAQARRLIVLVHGYNNTKADARKAYRQFCFNTALDRARVGVEVCEFYWPGDTGRAGSFLFYASQVPRAIESGARLADYFEDAAKGQPLTVIFICHSLGNRVALETAAELRRRQSVVTVERFCSMAAAVAVEQFAKGAGLHSVTQGIGASIVLWSAKDRALGYAFLIGQRLAGAGETATAAVGKTGGPALYWKRTKNFTSVGYGHSDYWPRLGSAFCVSEFLALTGIARVVQLRAAQEVVEPETRAMQHRALEGRRLGSDD
jgi:pimeloyl-ACP methyl ester carboxylesterase